jgi:hypothetical protein
MQAVLDRYQPGTVIREPAFTSSSANHSFPGNVQFEILSKNGRLIQDFASNAREAEVLFPPGTPFEVAGRAETADGVVIRLRELS